MNGFHSNRISYSPTAATIYWDLMRRLTYWIYIELLLLGNIIECELHFSEKFPGMELKFRALGHSQQGCLFSSK